MRCHEDTRRRESAGAAWARSPAFEVGTENHIRFAVGVRESRSSHRDRLAPHPLRPRRPCSGPRRRRLHPASRQRAGASGCGPPRRCAVRFRGPLPRRRGLHRVRHVLQGGRAVRCSTDRPSCRSAWFSPRGPLSRRRRSPWFRLAPPAWLSAVSRRFGPIGSDRPRLRLLPDLPAVGSAHSCV